VLAQPALIRAVTALRRAAVEDGCQGGLIMTEEPDVHPRRDGSFAISLEV